MVDQPERSTDDSEVRLLDEAEDQWRRSGPTAPVIAAFGVHADSLRKLPGGAGHTWTDGRVVLKPVGFRPEHDWVCEVYASWSADDVRVPEPVPPDGAAGERWSRDGWGAHVFVPGHDLDLPRDLPRVREAGDAFHHAIRELPRPGWLDERDDPWAFGDRLAWEGAEPQGDARTLELIARLVAATRPVSDPDQVIHGDLLPNVLADRDRAPAVIDWPPYFRPVAQADAVVVTDAITFRGAPMSLLDDWATGRDWDQVLIRALLYRLGPTGVFAAHRRLRGSLATHVDRVGPVVDAVLARLA